MSLMINFYPHRSGRNYWDVWDFPRRLVHQNFGLDLREFDDLFDRQIRSANSGTSEVTNDENRFEVRLDCRHFKPEELVVKTVGNSVVIEGKHEERDDNNGLISRQFRRRYALPEGCDAQKVVSSLSGGYLKVEAPKNALPEPTKEQRNVPIDASKSETKEAVEDKQPMEQ